MGYLWPNIFFYSGIIVTIILFIVLIDKSRLKELISVGLFIGVENYTLEILGQHFGFWKYPLSSPGNPETVVLSSIFFFPLIAMLFAQYLSNNMIKNVKLIGIFLSISMLLEIIMVKTTNIVIYQRGLNLFIAFLIYLFAYLLIMAFKFFYDKL